jgi:hypothetical protein
MNEELKRYTIEDLQKEVVFPAEFPTIKGAQGKAIKAIYDEMDSKELQGEKFKQYPQNLKYATKAFREFLKNNSDNLDIWCSNYGRIKINDIIQKPFLEKPDDPSNDALYVKIEGKNKATYYYLVYRFVAETWCNCFADIENGKIKYSNNIEDTTSWIVHHLTNDGYDNRPENLLWVSKALHMPHIHNGNSKNTYTIKDNYSVTYNKPNKTKLMKTPKNLKEYQIAVECREICDSAFVNCICLKNVEIPEGIIFIGKGAFAGCQELQSIEIPDSVTSIGDSAFAHCLQLKNVTISKNITDIRNHVFSDCPQLESIEIPNNVINIWDRAFADCRRLSKITIPANVKNIGYCAFNGCSKLESVEILGRNVDIGEYAFTGCPELKEIITSNGSINLDNYQGENIKTN